MRRPRAARWVVGVLVGAAACPAAAEQRTFVADPAQTRVDFTLGATAHTVHGTFRMKSGMVRFDDTTGAAEGKLILDATSGATGNNSRDKKMKKDVLETDKYPDIIFSPERVRGTVPAHGRSRVELEGVMLLHGQSHPITITVPLDISGDTASADVRFIVPYVQWGLKNPSSFILRVSDKVEIVVHVVGRMPRTSASQ
jgi:polyisoprenoid-binding protein YceI